MALGCTALALVLAAAPAVSAAAPAPADPAGDAAAASRPPADLVAEVVIRSHLYEGALQAANGVFCDPVTGEILVADTGNELIGIFDARGAPLFAFRDPEHLNQPLRVAADRKGRILVLDNDRTRVKTFDYRGNWLGPLPLDGVLDGKADGFSAMAFDPEGRLYVATNTQVLLLDEQDRIQMRFGRAGDKEGEFKSIVSLFVDAERIYVADREALAVQVFDRSGKFLRGWGAHETGRHNVSLPHGIAVDARGRIILLDMLRQEIKYYLPNGSYLESYGGIGRRPGEVSFPSDLSLDGKGRVCVADRGNDRVQVLAALEAAEARKEAR